MLEGSQAIARVAPELIERNQPTELVRAYGKTCQRRAAVAIVRTGAAAGIGTEDRELEMENTFLKKRQRASRGSLSARDKYAFIDAE